MLPCRLHRHLGVCDGYIEVLPGWRTQNGWADPRSAICRCWGDVCLDSQLDDPTGRCCLACHTWKVTLFADAVYPTNSADGFVRRFPPPADVIAIRPKLSLSFRACKLAAIGLPIA